MKIIRTTRDLKAFQRLALTVAATSAAMTGVAGFAIITQPASTSAPDMTREVTYVDPAADEDPTTTTTAPVAAEVAVDADRAEDAADRAEVAAGRAEVAAVKAETVVTSTTVTGPTATTSSPTTVTTSRPILVGVTETTTTTVTVPKAWVEVARIPASPQSYPNANSPESPINEFTVELASGHLRISDPVTPSWSSLIGVYGPVAVWVGDSDTPPGDACYLPQTDVREHAQPPTICELPTGTQTIKVARQWTSIQRDSTPIWRSVYANQADLVIEEYR